MIKAVLPVVDRRLALGQVFKTKWGDASPKRKCDFASVATLSVCEFVFDQSMQMITYRLMIQPLNHFV